MTWRFLTLSVLAVALGACSTPAPAPATPPAPPEQNAAPDPSLVGADRDANGCIPSAGYRWCARTNHCERPWELAMAKGFESSGDAFEGYCHTAQGKSKAKRRAPKSKPAPQ